MFLSYYFKPDLSAGSFRNTALVEHLSKQLGDKGTIHVITTQPNRYNSFRGLAAEKEVVGNVIIERISVPPHHSGFRDQIFSFLHYYRKVQSLTKGEHYDLVYASSSRLFTAYLGKTLAKRKSAPLYLDIRDIFVETMDEVLKRKPIIKGIVLKLIAFFVERPTFKYATHINLVSEGFRTYFEPLTQAKLSFYPNGIDDEFLNVKVNDILPEWPKVITYAGKIGEGQGLEKIIPHAAKKLGTNYQFIIIGDGGTKHLLQQQIEAQGVTNVQILPPVKRDALIKHYCASHYLFLHLNDYKAFERVLPSKIFEYGALRLPVISGVGGFAHSFMAKHVDNLLLFKPCEVEKMVELLMKTPYVQSDRVEFIDTFKRSKISSDLASTIIGYLK